MVRVYDGLGLSEEGSFAWFFLARCVLRDWYEVASISTADFDRLCAFLEGLFKGGYSILGSFVFCEGAEIVLMILLISDISPIL